MLLPPLLLLGAAELVLRAWGYGYPTGFFKKVVQDGRPRFIENSQFGLRFFPPGLARIPTPLVMDAEKSTNAIRIFIFGESAALGDPRPSYGAGRYLAALLRARFPGRKFEVVNASMTAINSHAILPIARECACHQGDLWIVYMGNNEMVGPFGAATVFGAKAPPANLVRFRLFVQQFRLGQLFADVSRKWSSQSAEPAQWQGMEMFLNNQVSADDPRKEIVYANFQKNLEDILRTGVHSGAKIVLSTVGVNLKDCAPFASLAETNLPSGARSNWNILRAQATAARSHADWPMSSRLFGEMTKVAPLSAEAQFGLGEASLHLGQRESAREHLQAAADTDTLPFRADSRVNAIIARAANSFDGSNLALCDSANILAGKSPNGITGREFFYEHVHLNFDGNYWLARAWAEPVAALLGSRLGTPARDWPPQAECERMLGLTDWNRSSVVQEVLERLKAPPFVGQMDNPARMSALSNELSQCQQRLATAGATQAARNYLDALQAEPDDYELHSNYAEFLEATHDPRALEERKLVCKLIPQSYFPQYRLALDLEEQGRLREAQEALEAAAALSPAQSEVRLQLGMIHARQSEWEAGRLELERARQLAPRDPRPCLYLGEVLWKLNRGFESIASLREAIRRQPSYWEAHYRLADELVQQQRIEDAAMEFQEVLRLNPDYLKARLNLGVALIKLGRGQEALTQFDEVLRLDPENKLALQFRNQALSSKPR